MCFAGPWSRTRGYGREQVAELEATLNRVDADLVLSATPIDLLQVVHLNKPVTRVRYDLAPVGGVALSDVIQPIVAMTRTPATAGR